MADAESVIKIWRDCNLVKAWNDPLRDIERKMAVMPELFLVGEVDGKIIASVMAGYDGHRGSVNYLAVKPGLQGSGYGQRLMQFVEDRLIELGCPKINLQVRTSNQNVIKYYERIAYARDDCINLGKRLIPDN